MRPSEAKWVHMRPSETKVKSNWNLRDTEVTLKYMYKLFIVLSIDVNRSCGELWLQARTLSSSFINQVSTHTHTRTQRVRGRLLDWPQAWKARACRDVVRGRVQPHWGSRHCWTALASAWDERLSRQEHGYSPRAYERALPTKKRTQTSGHFFRVTKLWKH